MRIMNKFFLYLIVFVSFFALAGLVSAQIVIPNPLNVWTIPDLLRNIFTAVAGLVGAISVIMIVIAGIFYLTSAGSPEKMETAKKALTYAIIGMVVAVAAVTIVDTVLWVIGAQ